MSFSAATPAVPTTSVPVLQPGPQPIPGSRFPERIQPREHFYTEEQVRQLILPQYTIYQ